MGCVLCGDYAPQLHHIVYRQELRRQAHTSGRNYTDLAADERNLIALCLPCHAQHHNRQQSIPPSALPDEAIRFARDLMGPGPAHNYLRRYYPGDDPRVDALDEIWGVEA